LIKAGQYESLYNGMPAFGLRVADKLVPATDNKTAAKDRLNSNS